MVKLLTAGIILLLGLGGGFFAGYELGYTRASDEYKVKLDAARNGHLTLLKKDLDKVLPNLKKYVAGENTVGEAYFESFQIIKDDIGQDDQVFVKLINHTNTEVRPSFYITFLSEYGFIVGEAHLYWFFDKIGPSEIRTDKIKVVRYRWADEPVYYSIRYE